jgi:predicted Zn-dependent protease with MMP-like domain
VLETGENPRVDVSPEDFESLVAEALDGLPPRLGQLMDNVAVIVQEWPTGDQLDGRRGTLLGLYEGIALTRRSPLSYAGVMPDRITIFQGPITGRANSREELIRLVGTTVIHEVAHHFGISDARLAELGWA